MVTLTLERFRDLRGEVPEELIVLVHTVNDPSLADELRRQGARGIYTSYLTPQTVPELFTRSSDRLSRPGGR